MRWAEACSYTPIVVGEDDRNAWADRGYLWFPELIPESDLAPLRDALGTVIDASRALSESTHLIDLEAGHSAEEPRLRRAADVDDVHEAFWIFCSESILLVITYTAADSIPYTASPYRSSHHGALVRGVEPGVAHHEELTLILPPDWSAGYTSLFVHQTQETETS